MDIEQPRSVRPQRIAISERSDRRDEWALIEPLIPPARSIAFITRFMWSAVSEANTKPAPPLPSSIAKASRALKKGALYRSAWL